MIKQHPPTHSWQETSTQQPVMMNTTEDMVSTIRGFNNFGDKRLFEVEQTAVIEKGP